MCIKTIPGESLNNYIWIRWIPVFNCYIAIIRWLRFLCISFDVVFLKFAAGRISDEATVAARQSQNIFLRSQNHLCLFDYFAIFYCSLYIQLSCGWCVGLSWKCPIPQSCLGPLISLFLDPIIFQFQNTQFQNV